MRAFHQAVLSSALWIIVSAGTALHAQQQQPIAGILGVNGNWQLNDQHRFVNAGQKLYAGDKIWTPGYNYANSITIVHFDDGSRTHIACENSTRNPCQSPYVVSAPRSNAYGQQTSLIRAALNLLLGTPPPALSHDSVTMSRGKYVVAVREDLVSFGDAKGVSLNGRIPILPAGVYNIETLNAVKGQTVGKAKIGVGADGAWQAPFSISTPGLYTINVSDANGDLRANLLLLLVKTSQYASARHAFEGIKNEADAWQGADAQSDDDLLLRAVLVAMSKAT